MLTFSRKALRTTAAGLLATTVMAGAASAVTLEITVTNEQAAGGLFLTPLLSIFHDGTYDAFDVGDAPTPGLQFLAEEGGVDQVIAEVEELNEANGTDFETAVAANPAGFPGAPVLDPGEVTTLTVDLDPNSQRYLTFLSMVIPSNDTFVGNDDPFEYELFDEDGNFVLNNAIEILSTEAWDAGTEADDGNGAAFAPSTAEPATDTDTGIAALADLDFLIGRDQAPGGQVLTASGVLASISISEVAPIPLPAGMPLLLAGLGAFGLARRYKTKAAAKA